MYKCFVACHIGRVQFLLTSCPMSLGRLKSKKDWQLFAMSILLILNNFIKKIYWQWNLTKKVLMWSRSMPQSHTFVSRDRSRHVSKYDLSTTALLDLLKDLVQFWDLYAKSFHAENWTHVTDNSSCFDGFDWMRVGAAKVPLESIDHLNLCSQNKMLAARHLECFQIAITSLIFYWNLVGAAGGRCQIPENEWRGRGRSRHFCINQDGGAWLLRRISAKCNT